MTEEEKEKQYKRLVEKTAAFNKLYYQLFIEGKQIYETKDKGKADGSGVGTTPCNQNDGKKVQKEPDTD
jgi:hypothetical protein